MPREERLKIYAFDELSEKAKARAIKDWRDKGYAWDETDTQWLTELFESDLKDHFGYEPKRVNWDLGYTQGSGVCFGGSVNWDVFLAREGVPNKFRRLKGKVYVNIANPGRDCHWNSMEVTVEDAGVHSRASGPKEWMPGSPSDDLLKEFEKFLVEDVKKTSKELEKMGYAEMEYKESDEGISEFFTSNEYEFREDGRMWKK